MPLIPLHRGGWKGGANPAVKGPDCPSDNPSNIPSTPPAQKKEKKKTKTPKRKRNFGANLQNKGGKPAKSVSDVTPASSRRSNMRSTVVATAAPDLSSDHYSAEEQHSSGDEETVSQREPMVHSTLHKLRCSNASLLSGKIRSQEKEVMFKTQIGELQSEVGQLCRDRADADIVSEDTTESQQAQIKAVENLRLVAINK